MLSSVLLLPKEYLMIFTFKFGMLQVRANGISLWKWSGGNGNFRSCAYLRKHWA